MRGGRSTIKLRKDPEFLHTGGGDRNTPFGWVSGRDTMPPLEATGGEKNRNAKLRDYHAAAICRLVDKGVDKKEIAALFGVTVGVINFIIKGQRYDSATLEIRREIARRKQAEADREFAEEN